MSIQEDLKRNALPIALASSGVVVFWGLVFLPGLTGYTDNQTVVQTEQPEVAASEATTEEPDTGEADEDVWQKAYDEALRLESTATGLSETALSPDDWSLIASRLERSVQLLEAIPESEANYSEAQAKLAPLKQQLLYAQKGKRVPEDPFPDAINAATNAANLTQSAQSNTDWEKIAESWQEAIDLLKQVPEGSPNLETANAKVTEYEKNLQYAQQQASKPAVAASQPKLVPARAPVSGSCDCPYDRTSSGSRCGGRSAYSRPGGRSPVCYVEAEE